MTTPLRKPTDVSSTSSTSSANSVSSAGTGTFRILDGMVLGARTPPDKPQDVEMAVHTYFQALRSLGRTRVSAAEVATALNLTESTVIDAANSLTAKGVKLLG